jgi:hypothetical protein
MAHCVVHDLIYKELLLNNDNGVLLTVSIAIK